MNPLVKAFTKFCFHFDPVCAIIIAHHKIDDQRGSTFNTVSGSVPNINVRESRPCYCKV